ncbi:monooxygenase [Pseudomonas sp. CCM 7891]|uniref:Monooxygenase n=1 Tax=Pseudomonas karstica TaxID=1055468 RepID=A0A7X2RXT0_9PSED|nr:antibiotic biosynthesis monooxygenase family protein [Pseudomonas karstica]MTD21892.1 monooxygenase [Pseudomonas karstica]
MPASAFNTVHVRATPGRSPALGERLQQIAEAVRTAPGCLDYSVQRSPVDPEQWTVSGRWQSVDQLHAHFRLPALQGFIELTNQCLASHLVFNH